MRPATPLQYFLTCLRRGGDELSRSTQEQADVIRTPFCLSLCHDLKFTAVRLYMEAIRPFAFLPSFCQVAYFMLQITTLPLSVF